MPEAIAGITGSWTRLLPIGRGASGAVVSLAADDASGEVFVVKSAGGHHGMQQLRREWSVMLGLSSPNVVGCLGYCSSGEDQLLFLEFAPGGSLADLVARNSGRLEEGAIRAYAADVVRGLDYLHRRPIVHGDVKGSNVLLGTDGRAKLADFGCARAAGDSEQTFSGTPAFMAPEVARGEEQGPAADVWALGCTVIEMATGCAPWSDTDNVLAVVRRIGFTDAVPEVPPWLSPEAKDFLDRCLNRNSRDRSTAAQLLEHPFVSMSPCRSNLSKKEQVISTGHWVSPTSALDVALWESESDDDEEDYTWNNPVSRIRAMACSTQAFPDWDSDEGWIEVLINPAAENDEFVECSVKLIKALACPLVSVPENWESEQGWIEVRHAPSAADADEKDDVVKSGNDVAAAAELFNDALRAVFSVEIGVCSDEDLIKRQEKNAFSLSCCSEQIVADAATINAGIEECSSFSYYLHLLSC